MCPDCTAQYMAWLDYKAPIGRWLHYSPSHETRARLSRENYSALVKGRYQLIREQTAAIRKHCHDNHKKDA